MSTPLSAFRYLTCKTVAKLPALKSIMRVEKRRSWQWWKVLPAVGEADARCVHIKTIKLSDRGHLALIDEREIIAAEQSK
jgi:hypothetical protein